MLWDTQQKNPDMATKLQELWGENGFIRKLADTAFLLQESHKIDDQPVQLRVNVCARSAYAFAALIRHHSTASCISWLHEIRQQFWQTALFSTYWSDACMKTRVSDASTLETQTFSIEIQNAVLDLFREFAAFSTRDLATVVPQESMLDSVFNSVVRFVGAARDSSCTASWSQLAPFKYEKPAPFNYRINLQSLEIDIDLKILPQACHKLLSAAVDVTSDTCEVRENGCTTEYIVGDYSLIVWRDQRSSQLQRPRLFDNISSRYSGPCDLSSALSAARGVELWDPHFEDVIKLLRRLYNNPNPDCHYRFENVHDGSSSSFLFVFFKKKKRSWYEVRCQNKPKGHGRGAPFASVYHVSNNYLLQRDLIFSSNWMFGYRLASSKFVSKIETDLECRMKFPHADIYKDSANNFEHSGHCIFQRSTKKRLILSESLEGLLPNCLLDKRKFWFLDSSPTNPVKSIVPDSDEFVIEILDPMFDVLDSPIRCKRTKDGLLLVNASSSNLSTGAGVLIRLFSRIERMDHVLFWGQENEPICAVELPRLRLEFRRRASDFFTVIQDQELVLVNCFSDAVADVLPSCIFHEDIPVHVRPFLQFSIILRNCVTRDLFLLVSDYASQGDRFELCRRDVHGRMFSSDLYVRDTWNDAATNTQKNTGQSISYILYPLNRFGFGLMNLVPSSTEARFAAFLHIAVRQHHHAARLVAANTLVCANSGHVQSISTICKCLLKSWYNKDPYWVMSWEESDQRFFELFIKPFHHWRGADGDSVTMKGAAAFPRDISASLFNAADLFPGAATLLKNGSQPVPISELASADVIGLYFSAHWCGPCKAFTPVLSKIYTDLKANGKAFEIVFVSADRDESSMKSYFEDMPWLALQWSDKTNLKDDLYKKYASNKK